jgi:GNAT superfamily N-acetyltransferase
MQFEKITINDLDRLGPLQPPDWGDIVPAFRQYLAQPFCFPIKTTVNGEIAGIGVAIILEGTGWLAHIIVHPGHRGQGIGGAVTRRLMEITGEQKCRTVSLIATDLGRPVYLKAGFVDQEDYLFFERETPLGEVNANIRIRSYTDGDRQAVLELDCRLSSESRERLLEGKLKGSYLHLDQRSVDGYYIPELGEGLVMAENEGAGLELLRLKLSRAAKNVLPAGNKAGVAFMLEQGYHETKRAKRMVWGEKFPWNPEYMFGRIAGNLG